MDHELRILIDLQALDTRIAGLERQLEAIPARIQTVRDTTLEARREVERLRTQLDEVKKETRAKEKELDYQASQRAKCEARLYEVKTNKEYSAVLAEIETLKVEKARIEEEVLSLMEAQERITREIGEAEARLHAREQAGQVEEGRAQGELREAEAALAQVRGERESLAREVPRELLATYQRLLRGRGGLAVVPVQGGICAGCHVALTPQHFQEVRLNQNVLACESCGRILYWVA